MSSGCLTQCFALPDHCTDVCSENCCSCQRCPVWQPDISTEQAPANNPQELLQVAPMEGGQLQVAFVAPDSPASRGGIRVGDVVVALDGRAVSANDVG